MEVQAAAPAWLPGCVVLLKGLLPKGVILPRDGKSNRILTSVLSTPLQPPQANSLPFYLISQPLKEGNSIS